MYKSIVSPYLVLSDFNINNTDAIDEYIVLTFKEEKYSIDFRWDRIIFISEGIRDDLKKAQGPLFTFFEIFGKLRALSTFGKIQTYLLAEWNLIEYEYPSEDIKMKFRNIFMSPKIPTKMSGLENEDASVTSTFGDSNKMFYRVTFGPFAPTKDVTNYNLSPISKRLPADIKDRKGIFSESFLYEKTSHADFESYKKASKIIESFLSNIKLDE